MHHDDIAPPPSPPHASAHTDDMAQPVPTTPQAYRDLLCDTSMRAAAFAAYVAERAMACAGLIRTGQDQAAFGSLATLSGHLQDFLSYLILAAEALPAEAQGDLHTLRDRILDAIAPMHGNLESGDLVELADAIEFDLVPALVAYEGLATAVHGALAA